MAHKSPRWRPEEIKFLRRMSETTSVKAISQALGRSIHSINAMRRVLESQPEPESEELSGLARVERMVYLTERLTYGRAQLQQLRSAVHG